MKIERIPYGTSTEAGELVRDTQGNYFAFESDKNNTRVMWSSTLGFAACLSAFEGAHPKLAQSSYPESSTVMFHSDSEPVDGSTNEIREIALDSQPSIMVAKLAYHSIDLTWQDVHKPFHDRDFLAVEVGLNLDNDLFRNPATRLSIENFASRTGNARIIHSGKCEVATYFDGKLQVLPLINHINKN